MQDRLLVKSDHSRVEINNGRVRKTFVGEEAQERFEREIAFLKENNSEYLPTIIEFDSKKFIVIYSLLRGETPGFLDNTEASLLSHHDFHRIRTALLSIQELKQGIIVHSDLAPHNIYLTKDRVVISDWDSYWITEKQKYRMYDFATLWSFLDTNIDHLIDVFSEVKRELEEEKLLADFKFCFQKRINFLQKYPKQWERSKELCEKIVEII